MVLAGSRQTPAAVLQWALENGASAVDTDKEGWNALHWAAFHNHPEAAQVLLRDGGSTAAERASLLLRKTDKGETPLEVAVTERNEDVANLIREQLSSGMITEGQEEEGDEELADDETEFQEKQESKSGQDGLRSRAPAERSGVDEMD